MKCNVSHTSCCSLSDDGLTALEHDKDIEADCAVPKTWRRQTFREEEGGEGKDAGTEISQFDTVREVHVRQTCLQAGRAKGSLRLLFWHDTKYSFKARIRQCSYQALHVPQSDIELHLPEQFFQLLPKSSKI